MPPNSQRDCRICQHAGAWPTAPAHGGKAPRGLHCAVLRRPPALGSQRRQARSACKLSFQTGCCSIQDRGGDRSGETYTQGNQLRRCCNRDRKSCRFSFGGCSHTPRLAQPGSQQVCRPGQVRRLRRALNGHAGRDGGRGGRGRLVQRASVHDVLQHLHVFRLNVRPCIRSCACPSLRKQLRCQCPADHASDGPGLL